MRILLAEDDNIVRQGTRLYLESVGVPLSWCGRSCANASAPTPTNILSVWSLARGLRIRENSPIRV